MTVATPVAAKTFKVRGTVRSTPGRIVVACLLVAAVSSTAAAQNWSFDARRIALGGIGNTGNIASRLVDEERGYGSIVLPFGLFQVFEDRSPRQGLRRTPNVLQRPRNSFVRYPIVQYLICRISIVEHASAEPAGVQEAVHQDVRLSDERL